MDIGLSLDAYFAGMNKSMRIMVDELYDGKTGTKGYGDSVHSITKLVHLDTAIVIETFAALTAKLIAEQSESLIKMSTPVSELWENILMLPVVGVIDSKRSQDILEAMLTKIAATQARYFILDISGVAVVDTAVANHMIKITKATKLMGCECAISGLSPSIAQTMVELGIDVGEIRTTGNLRDAVKMAFDSLNVEIR